MTRVRGFSLVEVLIAVTVLAVGLLGAAALQATSLRANQSANFRSQATTLAAMMLDAMRANRPAVLRGEYYAAYAGATCEPSVNVATTPAAKRDLALWRQQIACALPDGKGEIRFPGDNKVVVAIRWTDARWSAPGQTETEFSVESAL
ncbi:MAG TPA: type IV pilus modification protein PilV [Tahibacter sp.]|nr:type IV pilus modification protein PilV [Tahibacter sp.]